MTPESKRDRAVDAALAYYRDLSNMIEQGGGWQDVNVEHYILTAIRAAVADEREACARAAEMALIGAQCSEEAVMPAVRRARTEIAAAIRAQRRATPSAPDCAQTPDLGAPEGPATAAGAGETAEALFSYRARVYQYAPLEDAKELDDRFEAVLDAAMSLAAPPAAGSREATPHEH